MKADRKNYLCVACVAAAGLQAGSEECHPREEEGTVGSHLGALGQEHRGPLREHRESLTLLLLPHLSLSEPCDGELTACLLR